MKYKNIKKLTEKEKEQFIEERTEANHSLEYPMKYKNIKKEFDEKFIIDKYDSVTMAKYNSIWNFIVKQLDNQRQEIIEELKKIDKDYSGWGETERWFDLVTNLENLVIKLKK